MPYTREDYIADKRRLQFSAHDQAAMDAGLRVRLYEAGRYQQLNAVAEKRGEKEIAYARLQDDLRMEDDYVFQCQLAWLRAEDPREKERLRREYGKARAESEARKTQLQADFKADWGRPSAQRGQGALWAIAAVACAGAAYLLVRAIWG